MCRQFSWCDDEWKIKMQKTTKKMKKKLPQSKEKYSSTFKRSLVHHNIVFIFLILFCFFCTFFFLSFFVDFNYFSSFCVHSMRCARTFEWWRFAQCQAKCIPNCVWLKRKTTPSMIGLIYPTVDIEWMPAEWNE